MMMEIPEGFTSGPWDVLEPAPDQLVRIVHYDIDTDDYGRCVASEMTICEVADTCDEEANAALIRIAPDMAARIRDLEQDAAEAGALAARQTERIAALEWALRGTRGHLDDPTGGQHEADMRGAASIIDAALDASPDARFEMSDGEVELLTILAKDRDKHLMNPEAQAAARAAIDAELEASKRTLAEAEARLAAMDAADAAAQDAPLTPTGQALLDEAIEALRWYEGAAAGCRKIGVAGDPARHALDRDGGSKARAVLACLTAAQGECT